MHVYDGWLSSSSIAGPWTQSSFQPLGHGPTLAQQLAKAGAVDLLDGGPKANPKPSLANGVPTIYTSQVPTELIVFKGQPDFVPIVGTQLLWASNTTSDVLIDTANNNYYVLLAGRWFRSAALTGPWTFVAGNALPPDFAKIPPTFARRRRAADGRRHAAGAGGGDRELDSADGDGAAEERAEVHAELRRPAAVRADRRHAAVLRGQLVGADDPGRRRTRTTRSSRASGSRRRSSPDRGRSRRRCRR